MSTERTSKLAKEKETLEIEIPNRTYLKTIVALVLVFLVYWLSSIILLLFLSLLIAMTLTSMQRFLVQKGWNKKFATAFLILGLIGTISLIIFFVMPAAMGQLKDVLRHLPKLEERFYQMAPKEVKESAGKLIINSPDSMSAIRTQLGSMANQTLTGIFNVAIMLVAAIYMFIDGSSAYAWVSAFFSAKHRKRIDETVEEISPIVQAYILGQATTSTLAAVVVYTAATLLDVPSALTLAVLAAVFDILPGIGFILNATTAGFLSLVVSPDTAITMVIILGVYAMLESYVLIPFIYGSKMKLSPLVVLISLLFGGTVAGVPGMIAILPLIAAYAPIERRWLRREDLREAVDLHNLQAGDPPKS
ncbi:MAG TPA: AI-2E family transporter [Bacteriovoracaceae bacterium]|nr:AI-2E family transporter [Bacteriovoracaceae bacterium]